MSSAAQSRRRHRSSAARQALTLCEAELLARPRVSAAVATTALWAAGLPPHLAATLRGRMRQLPEQAAKP